MTNNKQMTYPNLSDEEILKLRDAISHTISTMKKDIKKDKLRFFGKALLAFVVVSGGVAVSILFPNPITIGVLGGAATLIAGSNGMIHKTKKMKEKSKEKRKNKEEVKNIDTEQSNRKWATYMQSLVNQPSAPNLYPDLKQFKKKKLLN